MDGGGGDKRSVSGKGEQIDQFRKDAKNFLRQARLGSVGQAVPARKTRQRVERGDESVVTQADGTSNDASRKHKCTYLTALREVVNCKPR
ncbi:hypothetical protein E2C01_048620 [Portunus trituberculatus]|uniref:Uncharacterized protein n=1 Tax=Portunus trituberculatus TaxID=210409 RepID=A0A5B7GB13_PORTR|nr:hypothetical protein [Portunus trituberculatus]